MKDGGQAFPLYDSFDGSMIQDGMTLRDYFAGQALIGLISNFPNNPEGNLSANAYYYADAMIAEGEK